MHNPFDMIMTWPRKRFLDVLHPDPEAIEIEDIAHALGMACRYGGHVPRFYSVAEHCVLLARYVFGIERSKTLAYALLMHDAPEGYLCDLLRPTKKRMPEYCAAEARLDDVIAQKFGVEQLGFLAEEVSSWDFRMLRTEMVLMYGAEFVAKNFPHIIGARPMSGFQALEHWTPEQATGEFLAAYEEYQS